MAPISERLKAVFSKSRSRSSSRTPTGNEPTRTSQQPGQGLNRPQLLPQVSQASGSDGNSGASSGAQTGALDIPASDHQQQGPVPAEAIAIPKDPWDEAYDGLRKKEPKLLACYERFLLSEASKSKPDDAAQRLPDLSSLDNFERQSRLGAVLEAQKGALESAALGFKLGDYQVVVKDEFKRLVSAVIWAKDFIAAGAKNEPHAALAWAGVSVLLPLLLNPALQEKAATEALDHIQHVVLRYRVIQKGLFPHDPTDAVLADETSKLVTGLRSNTVKLYTHILELQLRMAIYLCRGTVSQYFRDVAKVDDWEDMLKQVKATEVDGEAMIQTLSHDKVDQIKRSTKEQAEQFAKVLLILESQGPVLHDIALRTKRIEDTQTKHIESHDAKARLLDSLYFPDYKLRVDSLTLPESKTFDWIFKTNSARTLIDWPSFPEWLERDSDPYWITGKAGSGKSTIMALIAGDAVTKTHLRVWAKDTVPHIFRFFFWRLAENTLMKSLEGMLRSLLYQIFRAMPELAKIIADQHVEDAIRIPTWTVQKLADLMMTSLALVTGEHSILFILDGLDELEGDQHTLLEFLKPMSGFSCVKLCLSSRAEVQLDRWFGCKAHLQMERLNARDIRIYAEQRLHSLVPTKELAKLTADRADGVFLWAVLVTDDLLRCIHKGYDESALEKRLARRPKKIEDLFAEILRGVDEDDRTTVYFFVRSMLLPRYHHPVTGRSYPLNIGLLATVMFAQETHISYQAFASKCAITETRILTQARGLLVLERPRLDLPSHIWAVQDMMTGEIPLVSMEKIVKARRLLECRGVLGEIARYQETNVQWLHRSVYDYIMEAGLQDLFGDQEGLSDVQFADAWLAGQLRLLTIGVWHPPDPNPNVLFMAAEQTIQLVRSTCALSNLSNNEVTPSLDKIRSLLNSYSVLEIGVEWYSSVWFRDCAMLSTSQTLPDNFILELPFWCACVLSTHFEYINSRILTLGNGLERAQNLVMFIFSGCIQGRFQDFLELCRLDPVGGFLFGIRKAMKAELGTFQSSEQEQGKAGGTFEDTDYCVTSCTWKVNAAVASSEDFATISAVILTLSQAWLYWTECLTGFAGPGEQAPIEQMSPLIARTTGTFISILNARGVQLNTEVMGSRKWGCMHLQVPASNFPQSLVGYRLSRAVREMIFDSVPDSIPSVHLYCKRSPVESRGEGSVVEGMEAVFEVSAELAAQPLKSVTDTFFGWPNREERQSWMSESLSLSQLANVRLNYVLEDDELRHALIDEVWADERGQLDGWQQLYVLACLRNCRVPYSTNWSTDEDEVLWEEMMERERPRRPRGHKVDGGYCPSCRHKGCRYEPDIGIPLTRRQVPTYIQDWSRQ